MKITVYCGANPGLDSKYGDLAKETGEWIVDHGHSLVYGAGDVGLMGIVSHTVIDYGGEVIGIIPHFLAEMEKVNPDLTECIFVDDMSQRKRKMFDLGQAFIALPGGPGTLEEITEVISWSSIGQNDSPCILFNKDGYFEPLRAMYDMMVTEGFMLQSNRDKILFSEDWAEIEEFIDNYEAPILRTYEK